MIDEGESTLDLTKKVVEIPCESCGKPVLVVLPFLGCIYCPDCSTMSSDSTEGSEYFISRWR